MKDSLFSVLVHILSSCDETAQSLKHVVLACEQPESMVVIIEALLTGGQLVTIACHATNNGRLLQGGIVGHVAELPFLGVVYFSSIAVHIATASYLRTRLPQRCQEPSSS